MTETDDVPEHDLTRTADIVVRRVVSESDLAQATAMLDTQELLLGIPLVDEAERQRLDEAAATGGDAPIDERWRPIAAYRGDELVGYAALVLPESAEGEAVGDLAAARLPGAWMGILPALLTGLEAVVGTDAAELQVWVRKVDIGDLAPAVAAGYRVDRRLGVLGRDLDVGKSAPGAPEGTTIRAYRPDVDDEVVVEILAAAYAGSDDGGWDQGRFERRRAMPWFRPEDLLVAVDAEGRGRGLHWLKRRDAITGEVYNLAIHPDAQGQGLGPVLLEAGLAHLRSVGLSDVILWVDRANERAVSLYTSRGFVTRWDDVALVHQLPHTTPGPGASIGD